MKVFFRDKQTECVRSQESSVIQWDDPSAVTLANVPRMNLGSGAGLLPVQDHGRVAGLSKQQLPRADLLGGPQASTPGASITRLSALHVLHRHGGDSQQRRRRAAEGQAARRPVGRREPAGAWRQWGGVVLGPASGPLFGWVSAVVFWSEAAVSVRQRGTREWLG